MGRVAARKPLLSMNNFKKRLAFAKEHIKWSKKNGQMFYLRTNLSLNYLAVSAVCLYVDNPVRDLISHVSCPQ
jgi:hypothetical protein